MVDDAALYGEIAEAKRGKNRTRLRAARTEVLASYRSYRDNAPELENLPEPSLTRLQREALIHAFEVETVPLKSLRAKILDEAIEAAKCPLCGMGETSTLDHYLPKEQYPQYAVFSQNLVPACPHCNTLKRDRILDEHTQVRLFLHPYFDRIPSIQFLHVDANLQPQGLRLNFRLGRPSGMRLNTFRHLQSHFRLLKLGDRYRRMSLEYLGGQYPSLKRAYGASENAERVSAELLEEAEDSETAYGENFWIAVLFRALAELEDFCDGGFEIIKPRRRT